MDFASLSAAKTALGAPADANYVMWPSSATYLHQALRTLGPNDILVLPERTAPYLISTVDGFRASGVVAVDGPNGTKIPVNSKYSDNGKNANMWFSMARATRGIIGLGDGVKIELDKSSWSQGPQVSPPEGVSNPTPEQHRKAYLSDGRTQVLYGAQESLIESDTANAFFANFTMTGRDLGGVAHTAIKFQQGGTVKNVSFYGAGRGFSGIPNGEAGSVSFGRGTYHVENVEIDGRDKSTNLEVGSSPIMVNRSTGGTIKNVSAHHHHVGMPTVWFSTGTHNWTGFSTYAGERMGVNLEKNYGSLTLNWTGGTVEVPANGYHFNMNSSDGSSQKLNIKDVSFKGGRAGDGVMVSHGYSYGGEVQGQNASDIYLTHTAAGSSSSATATKDNTGLNRAFGTIR